jgi:tetratricopeptide (TPR) repeat protein
LHDRSGLAALCNNLGIIASNRGDTATYMNLMYQAIEMNEETGNKKYLAVNHGNLGMIFREKKMFDSALVHANIAYNIRKENNFKEHLSGSYTDLGKIMFAQKKYPEALGYYKQGAALAKSISGTEWLVGNYESLGETYAAMDSTQQAASYTKLAEDVKKAHQNDTAVSKLLLPSSFDFKEPQSNAAWPIFTGGGLVVICVAVFGAYRRKKKQSA